MKLEASNLYFGYNKDDTLRNVELRLDASEILGIVGPNGSGKTTLLRCINRILTPRQGSIALDEEDVRNMSNSDIAKKIAYVPQNSKSEICTPSVFEVVLMGRRPHIQWQFGKNDEDIAWAALEDMGVKHLAAHSFDSLSSGQSQRVLMARALAQEAEVLLLDEPTSNLDIRYQIEVMDTVHNLVHGKCLSSVAVIHDLDLAMRFCDKIILLNHGEVIASGKTSDVLSSELISAVFGVDVVVDNIYGRNRVIIL